MNCAGNGATSFYRVGRFLYGIISGIHRKFPYANITMTLTASSLFLFKFSNGCGSIFTLSFQRLRVSLIEGHSNKAKTMVSNYDACWPFGSSLSYTKILRGIYWLAKLGNAMFYALRHS